MRLAKVLLSRCETKLVIDVENLNGLSRDTPTQPETRLGCVITWVPRPRHLIGMQLAPRYQPLKRTMLRRPRPAS